jgi:hypothetical protein
MKMRAAISCVVVLGLILTCFAVWHLIAPKKPPGGWYQGGPFELTIVHGGGISGMIDSRVRISNETPLTNLLAAPWPQVLVSGKSAGEIAHLLNHYDVDQWGHEAHFAGMDHKFYSAYLSYQGEEYKWTWHGSQNRPSLSPPPGIFTKIKNMVKKPKYPRPHTAEMEMLRHDILQVMLNNTNDLTIIQYQRPTNTPAKPSP